MNYMSVQKLRTPKGLGWLSELPAGRDRNHRLMLLQEIQNVFCATWTECIWLIADATKSDTKFIISDHPVTVYNRACFPGSVYCQGFNDPDIRMVATHTYFPLSIDKVLILTNLAWVRNPYQKERDPRPNPGLFRNAIMNLQDIQTCRSLYEQEVLEINYITKKRALRYIAAAEKDWLYPEKRLPSTHWSKFGHGYLLMPEPREVHMGGETYIGYKAAVPRLGMRTVNVPGNAGSRTRRGTRLSRKLYSDSRRNLQRCRGRSIAAQRSSGRIIAARRGRMSRPTTITNTFWK